MFAARSKTFEVARPCEVSPYATDRYLERWLPGSWLKIVTLRRHLDDAIDEARSIGGGDLDRLRRHNRVKRCMAIAQEMVDETRLAWDALRDACEQAILEALDPIERVAYWWHYPIMLVVSPAGVIRTVLPRDAWLTTWRSEAEYLQSWNRAARPRAQIEGAR